MSRRYVVVIVCFSLAAVAGAFLITAIPRVRDTAARMSCTGNLKQWALGLHNCAEAHPMARNGKSLAALPAGTLPHADLPPEQRLSWLVPMLPYMEKDAILKQFDLTRGPGDPINEKAADSRFPQLVCPRGGQSEYEQRGDSWKRTTPLTHYVGVAGVGADAATLPLGHPRAGVFGYDRRTALPDGFLDGTSNTLLLIETANKPGHWAYGGTATVRGFEPGAAPYIGPGRAFGGFHNGPPVLFGERSHTGLAALADGSVRWLSNTTASEVLEALATVGGKEELPANW